LLQLVSRTLREIDQACLLRRRPSSTLRARSFMGPVARDPRCTSLQHGSKYMGLDASLKTHVNYFISLAAEPARRPGGCLH
jgi:hypothetical protein